jgi:methionyl-tRNA synthetase
MIGEATFHATARFEDGKTTVKITAVTPYGDRSTSTVREIEDPKAVEAFEQLFKKAIDSAAEEMKRHSFNEAARNVVAAIDRAEDIHEQKPHVRVKNYDELQKEREAKAKQVRAELGSGKTTKEK